MTTNTITRTTTTNKAFNAKMRRLVKSRKGSLRGISANDFLDFGSGDISHMFRAAIREYGLRINGRVKATRPGRKGAYINNYAV